MPTHLSQKLLVSVLLFKLIISCPNFALYEIQVAGLQLLAGFTVRIGESGEASVRPIYITFYTISISLIAGMKTQLFHLHQLNPKPDRIIYEWVLCNSFSQTLPRTLHLIQNYFKELTHICI